MTFNARPISHPSLGSCLHGWSPAKRGQESTLIREPTGGKGESGKRCWAFGKKTQSNNAKLSPFANTMFVCVRCVRVCALITFHFMTTNIAHAKLGARVSVISHFSLICLFLLSLWLCFLHAGPCCAGFVRHLWFNFAFNIHSALLLVASLLIALDASVYALYVWGKHQFQQNSSLRFRKKQIERERESEKLICRIN